MNEYELERAKILLAAMDIIGALEEFSNAEIARLLLQVGSEFDIDSPAGNLLIEAANRLAPEMFEAQQEAGNGNK